MIPLGILASSVRRASAALLAPTNLVATLVEPAPILPTVIGEEFGGGYYIGDITIGDGGGDDGVYAVIMGGPESQATLAWKSPRSSTPGTDSNTNGMANTLAMQANDPVIHYAGMYCLGYGGGGFDDWYLPAKDELNLAWVNRSQLVVLAMEAQYYWSSSQTSTVNAWSQYFGNGIQSNGNLKDTSYRVRPVRKLRRP